MKENTNPFLKKLFKRSITIINNPKLLPPILLSFEELIRNKKINEQLSDLLLLKQMAENGLKGHYQGFSKKTLLILIATILYFLNPFDAIFDAIPILGFIDDFFVLRFSFKTLQKEIAKYKSWVAEKDA